MQTIVSPTELYLRNIALHPDVQGQGMGTRLVKQLQEQAAKRNVPFNLSLFRTNHRAARFYERLGFERTGAAASNPLCEASPCLAEGFHQK